MFETDTHVRLDRFDGPLELLLHLIQKEEMSIKDVDIGVITGHYLDYIHRMRDLNFDLAGDFLLIAATLLAIKSNECLLEGDEKDLMSAIISDGKGILTKTELIARLEELEHFQKLGAAFMTLPQKGREIFTKPRVDRKAIINSILTPLETDTLTQTMIDFIRREKRKFTVLHRDRLSIKEKLVSLKDQLKIGDRRPFHELLGTEANLDNTVITFISVLELARLKKLSIFQDESSGNELMVDVIDSLDSFDVEAANGFEDGNTPPSVQ